ncbi:MAG: LysR family transcriptional regulator [Roseiarcus sp.]
MIDSLTLDHMRALVAVAETGSFSAAGKRLDRVQSAVSQSIQAMESTLGVTLFDRSSKTPTLTEAGRAVLCDARAILAQTRALRARAESIVEGLEAELTLAVDALFPMPTLIESLAALRLAFPALPATVFTEELGGAVRSVRSGTARIAIQPMLGGEADDLSVEYLTSIALTPVVSVEHPLAHAPQPVPLEALEPHVQLVLTGRTDFARSLSGGLISRQLWRFADLHTRLEFLLAGFGWCRMPAQLVDPYIAAGRLVRLAIADEGVAEMRVFVARERGRSLGRAGRWLIDDLRRRLNEAPEIVSAA